MVLAIFKEGCYRSKYADYEVDSIIVNIHWGIEQDPYFTYEQKGSEDF